MRGFAFSGVSEILQPWLRATSAHEIRAPTQQRHLRTDGGVGIGEGWR